MSLSINMSYGEKAILSNHINNMNEQLISIYQEISNKVVQNLSYTMLSNPENNVKVIFEGIVTRVNTQNQIEIEIGQTKRIATDKHFRMQEARTKLTDLENQIKQFKLEKKLIIQLAGDLGKETIEKLYEKAILVCEEKKPPERQKTDSELLELQDRIEKVNSECLVKPLKELRLSSDVDLEFSDRKAIFGRTQTGTEAKLGGFCVEVGRQSSEEKQLKVKLVYTELLLEHYKSTYKDRMEENCKVYYCSKFHKKGIPTVIVYSNVTEKGYLNGNAIEDYERLELEAYYFRGKKVDNRIYGKGKLLFENRSVFEGQIFENEVAQGSITSGNCSKEGKWKLVTNNGTRNFIETGYMKHYYCKKLIQEGYQNGNTFEGTIYQNGQIAASGYFLNGEMQRGKVYSGNKVTQLEKTDPFTFKYTNYVENELVESGFIVNNKKEGNIYKKQGDLYLYGNCENDQLVQATIKAPNWSYDGEIARDKFSGYGEYKCSSYTYKGEYSEGLKHGFGDLETNEYRYVGEFLNDLFNGEGILEFGGCKQEGYFWNGNFISGTVTENGVKYNYTE